MIVLIEKAPNDVSHTQVAVSSTIERLWRLGKCYKKPKKQALWRETKQYLRRISHDLMAMQTYARNPSNMAHQQNLTDLSCVLRSCSKV
jgi:hypothetical protein